MEKEDEWVAVRRDQKGGEEEARVGSVCSEEQRRERERSERTRVDLFGITQEGVDEQRERVRASVVRMSLSSLSTQYRKEAWSTTRFDSTRSPNSFAHTPRPQADHSWSRCCCVYVLLLHRLPALLRIATPLQLVAS